MQDDAARTKGPSIDWRPFQSSLLAIFPIAVVLASDQVELLAVIDRVDVEHPGPVLAEQPQPRRRARHAELLLRRRDQALDGVWDPQDHPLPPLPLLRAGARRTPRVVGEHRAPPRVHLLPDLLAALRELGQLIGPRLLQQSQQRPAAALARFVERSRAPSAHTTLW